MIKPDFVSYTMPDGKEKAKIVLDNGLALLMDPSLLVGRELEEYEILSVEAIGTMEVLDQFNSEAAKKRSVNIVIHDGSDHKPVWLAPVNVIWDGTNTNVEALVLTYGGPK